MLSLREIFAQSSQKILDMVDNQVDFVLPHQALSISPATGCKEDASEIVQPTEQFLAALPRGAFQVAVVKFDTHFEEEYKRSPERIPFPNPHCVFGTKGWDLAVNIDALRAHTPTYIMAKNEFDMWGTNPTGVQAAEIALTPEQRRAYNHLFQMIPLQAGQQPQAALIEGKDAIARDAFMAAQNIGQHTVVVLFGVASDVCDAFAIAGYLKRGATVVVVDDLCRGIGAPSTFAPLTGTMAEVVETLATHYPEAAQAGRLRRAHTREVLAALM